MHDDHFARDASDETWLGEVGAKGWVVLSKDDRIRRNPVMMRASAHRCRDRSILPRSG